MSRKELDELKQQIPLRDYLEAYDWRPVRRLSRGRWMGLCPLHADRQPSFLMDPGKNLFYCYGCGRGGDVIRFAEIYHQVRFPQALEHPCCTKSRVSIACSYTVAPRRLLISVSWVSRRLALAGAGEIEPPRRRGVARAPRSPPRHQNGDAARTRPASVIPTRAPITYAISMVYEFRDRNKLS